MDSENRNCQKTVLENGIRVVSECMPEVRSISMGVLVNAGPRDEVPEKFGLAHLTEHMMFQGTRNRNVMQIARMMDSSGGQMGGFTTKDYTFYSATVLDDYRTYALELIGDILLNSIFPEDKLKSEKQSILREIDAERDIPHQRVHSLLKSLIWKDHPLGRPVTGNADSVTNITRNDTVKFVKEHYAPDRMVVVAAGHVNHQDFVSQVRDAFWSMSGKSAPTLNPEPQFHSGVTIEYQPVYQVYFSIGVRALRFAHPERYPLFLLNNLLGVGISSRLFRKIREEQGRVYDITSEYLAYLDDGVLVIEGSTTPEHLHAVLEQTLKELLHLFMPKTPVDDEELWKTKMQLRSQHIIGSENPHTRMSRLATQELYFGRNISADEILAEIDNVDAFSLDHLVRERLPRAMNNISIAVVGPKSPAHYTISSIEALYQKVIDMI